MKKTVALLGFTLFSSALCAYTVVDFWQETVRALKARGHGDNSYFIKHAQENLQRVETLAGQGKIASTGVSKKAGGIFDLLGLGGANNTPSAPSTTTPAPRPTTYRKRPETAAEATHKAKKQKLAIEAQEEVKKRESKKRRLELENQKKHETKSKKARKEAKDSAKKTTKKAA